MAQGALPDTLWPPRAVGWRLKREEIDLSLYIVMTDLRCMAETNTTIKQLSSNLESNN